MRGLSRPATLATQLLACALLSMPARAAGKLWGDENLLAGAPLRVNDIVTIIVAKTRPDAQADGKAAKEWTSGKTPGAVVETLTQIAARVVKVLPNGAISLEARARVGGGTILLGGETSRQDVSVDRTVPLSRLADLAIVARGLDERSLAGLLSSAPDARVATGEPRAARAEVGEK
jgi:flagellar basal body L-ring protein FlgH